MRHLSAINQEIILLKDIQGLALEEIAGILDLPLGTVKSRSSRARLELAAAITKLGGGPGPAGVKNAFLVRIILSMMRPLSRIQTER